MKKRFGSVLFLGAFLVTLFLGIGTFAVNRWSNNREFFDPEYDTNVIRNVYTFNLSNKDIKSKYQFVFLSDLHLSVMNDKEKNEDIKKHLEERHALFTWDDVTSEIILKEVVKYTNNKNANALLLGGDIVDSPAESNLNFLRDSLKELKTDYLYTFGNHDWTFLWDYQSEETEKKYVPKFKEFMDDTDVSYIEYKDLIVLAINDGKEKIEKDSLRKIKKVLDKKKPTIVMMHIPMATEKLIEENKDKRERMSLLGDGAVELDENTRDAFKLITSNKYKVFYILAGHVHVKMEDRINDRIYEIVTPPAYERNINLIKINN